ncbi:PREDICTED: uncharacterized protein LOC107068332 [Polistes dominula]|uniref:Uncharacterized protein LOC107068332 n=1 Tax=Polistes dominula TaxID=743375 RepID=A0ABM1IIP8_POLDO|nr:PREDICTED: uncharacterized protein LOC107068332 [Polistes dominula]XP_015180085.1 PREDICTED: uncharacterized protein LOC107068332 [Polistes dominula]
MLTVMCPNCRLEFLANEEHTDNCSETMPCTEDTWYMTEEQYTNDSDCLINPSPIINIQNIPKYSIQLDDSHNDHMNKIIQTEDPKCVNNKSTKNNYSSKRLLIESPSSDLSNNQTKNDRDDCMSSSICRITSCDLTGGSVTISTPIIQSGDCFIYNTDSCTLVETPYDVIHPKLSVGGRYVQTKISTNDHQDDEGSDGGGDGDGDGDGSSAAKSSTTDKKNCGCVSSRFREHIYSNEIAMKTPSGCQELPGNRRNNPSLKCCSEKRPIEDDSDIRNNCNESDSGFCNIKIMPKQDCKSSERNYIQEDTTEPLKNNLLKQPPLTNRDSNNFSENLVFCPGTTQVPNHIDKNSDNETFDERNVTMVNNGLPFNPSSGDLLNNSNDNESLRNSNGIQLQLNATLQLPPDIDQCSLNITATTKAMNFNFPESTIIVAGKSFNNFNGGGIIKIDNNIKRSNIDECSSCQKKEETSSTTDMFDTDMYDIYKRIPWSPPKFNCSNLVRMVYNDRLMKIKKYLRTSGWYHEDLSWQQSEILLKNVAVGRWLMRDSSDCRFTFAISVQTERGPTSVRIQADYGNDFRLDADINLINDIPSFNCPISLLEYYIEYSKRKKKNERRREVWVDYNGLLYGQIYLTEPLVKEVRSLCHLARLAIHKHNLPTYNLPYMIRDYVSQYPYTI